MRKVLYIFLLLLWLLQRAGMGQSIGIRGWTVDEEGQLIEGVTIADSLGSKISQSEQDGSFSLSISLPRRICFTKPGYVDTCITVTLENTRLSVVMRSKITQVNAVIISGEGLRFKKIESGRLGTASIKTDSIRQLPTLTGEVDPLKVLQLTPGVGKFDLSSGLLVRGSTMDQNLVIFD